MRNLKKIICENQTHCFSSHCLRCKERLFLLLVTYWSYDHKRQHSWSCTHSDWVCSLHLISFVLASAAIYWGKKILFVSLHIEACNAAGHCETPFTSFPLCLQHTSTKEFEILPHLTRLSCFSSQVERQQSLSLSPMTKSFTSFFKGALNHFYTIISI